MSLGVAFGNLEFSTFILCFFLTHTTYSGILCPRNLDTKDLIKKKGFLFVKHVY